MMIRQEDINKIEQFIMDEQLRKIKRKETMRLVFETVLEVIKNFLFLIGVSTTLTLMILGLATLL